MTRHIASVHEGKKAFKCQICDKSFSQKGSMNKHMASVHEEIKAFKCDICRYGCSKKVIMDKHMVSVHEEGDILTVDKISSYKQSLRKRSKRK